MMASEAQRTEIGPFMLRSPQKTAIRILSKIVQTLLNDNGNNLFKLSDLLSSEKKCGDLFVIVSTTVQKEFQLLKFPDPRNPSHMATLSFLPRSGYPPMLPDSISARGRACNEITHFLIRLITLAAACTASVSRNERIADIMDVAAAETPSNTSTKQIRDVPASIVFSNPPLDTQCLDYLKKVFIPIDATRRPNLYRYETSYTYIMDVKRSIVYNASASFAEGRTPVFKVTMELLKNQHPLSAVERAPIAPPAPPQYVWSGAVAAPPQAPSVSIPPPAPAAIPPQPSAALESLAAPTTALSRLVTETGSSAPPPSQISALGGLPLGGGGRRKSRKNMRNLRKTRGRRHRIHGGGDATYVKMRVEEIPYDKYPECESRGVCEKITFVIDNEGNTYDIDAYNTFQLDHTKSIPSSGKIGFVERILPLFNKIQSHRIMTTEYEERPSLSQTRYKPLSGASADTLQTFTDYRDDMSTLKTGAAPAPYRGFLLASRYAGNSLSTFFCQDEWADQFMTATLSYNLLQALYDDGVAGTAPSPRSLDACLTAARTFIGAQVAAPAARSGSEVENFRNLRFSSIPSALDLFCKTRRPQTTEDKVQQDILINAQREIRGLYDKHIIEIIQIMKKAIFITTDPAKEGGVLINLNEEFGKNPVGGLVVLERIIEEARNLISAHYLEVEKRYVGALLALGRRYRGINNSASLTGNKLSQISNKLSG